MISKSTLLCSLLMLLVLCSVTAPVYGQQSNRIQLEEQDIFLSGSNVAWVNFARDIGPGQTRLDLFEEMFSELNEHGGNAMRLWLHTNGTVTPEWDGNVVSGPGDNAITDLRAILDLAYDYDISLMLCLWSFDMLQTGQLSDLQEERNMALLTDSTALQSYIDHALIPMVDSLKSHPAINAWEIFNEPEGMTGQFGWTPTKVNMSRIQWFVNRTAGAIQRTDPDTYVTNGSWSIRASTDVLSNVPNSKNYYSDDELIAAGGDEDGILDFYTVHYYEHFGITESPFHNNASTWQLDKPLVIGEFYMSDPRNDGDPDASFGVPWDDYYEQLYLRGYAGALGWQWFDWYNNRTDIDGVDGTLSWPRMLANIKALAEDHPRDVTFLYPGIRINFNADQTEIEEGQQVLLTWNVRGAESVTLNGDNVSAIDSVAVLPQETTVYTLIATDAEGMADSATVTIQVLDPSQINRALNKPVWVSSVETQAAPNNQDDPSAAVDGDDNTRWSSEWENNEWIYVDLGASYDINQVILNWESAYGTAYTIDFSDDGQNWTTVFEEENGNGGIDSVEFEDPSRASYVRMYGISRATEFGFSLWEMEVSGVLSEEQAPRVHIASPEDGKVFKTGSSLLVEAEASDTDGNIAEVAFFFNGDSLGAVSEPPYFFEIESIPEGIKSLYVTALDDGGIRVQSSPIQIEGSSDFTTIRYEAEASIINGNVEIQNDAAASGGRYIFLIDNEDGNSGTISWGNLGWPDVGEYLLEVGYNVPFGEKEQELLINGEVADTLDFNGPLEQWLTLNTTITHAGGINEIGIRSFWGYMYIDYIELSAEATEVSNEEEQTTGFPTAYNLSQNYPNPFNPVTNISFNLPEAGFVNLKIFNMLGQEVAVLVSQRQSSGSYTLNFDASHLSSGIYIYQLQSGPALITRKMTLIK